MGTNLAHTELGNFGFSYITPNLVCFAESTSGDISSLAVALIRTSYCMGVSVSDRNVAILVTAILLWVLAEGLREWFGVQADALRMAASDFVKSGACLALWVIQRRTAVNGSFRELSTEEQPLNDIVPSPDDDAPDDNDLNGRETWPPSTSASLGTGSVNFQSAFIAVLIGGIFSFRTLVDSRSRGSTDALTWYLAIPATNLCILSILRTFFTRTFPTAFWHATVIQFSGLLILRDGLIGNEDTVPWPILLALAFCNSIFFSLTDVMYNLHQSTSIHLINTLIFASSCIFGLALFAFQVFPAQTRHNDFQVMVLIIPLVEAGRDIFAIYIVQQYDAMVQGISTSLASTFLSICIIIWFSHVTSSTLIGCAIVAAACAIYAHSLWLTLNEKRETIIQRPRLVATAATFAVALAYSAIVLGRGMAFIPQWSNDLGTTETTAQCIRKPLPSHQDPQTQGNYEQFSDVLLVVFFSHARYNANLDYHKEVYSSYFPNILYIGPASREDAGFSHSYDVYVDSYQSDEDLSDPSFYKMAGRMAHHMLYTALHEHECYKGYLWAPFDTLLNVPRLQQFNQSLFWYHSPWGRPVPNPTFGLEDNSGTLNKSRHAPTANISPDPSLNLTENWRGWGKDWWWGDPHVGVSVCMEAFLEVPRDLRANLAALTNGVTRLIGGSADTLYIPGRHRKLFMEVLALFLETNCFLEIATPTAVHLVLPPGEQIEFVDHWWIYQPPFNATFVRQKWAEGLEVDTFHTFHWGERGGDGIWRGDHRHVDDVRNLLQESASRQGVTFPPSSTPSS